ncbi:peptidylprolyl isomerase [Patescibacteria group bacterium]|nr:peptidylprolyl isomerase [Patescibacteria group bacterium]
MTQKINPGDIVEIEYEGRLKDGKLFDSSKKEGQSQPLKFKVGSGEVIGGFDNAVLGMEKGESKDFSIEPSEGYGEIKEDLKKEIPKSVLPKNPEGKEPSPGMILILQGPNGERIPARIDRVTEENILLDLNHPLAGEKLFFKIKVVDIQPGKKSLEDSKVD